MLFNEARLQEALEQYKKDFPNWFKKEKYKWEAVETFQKYWNIDAPDFSEMLNLALSKTKNLLAAFAGSKAKDAIIHLAETAPEETRAMFKALFDEGHDIDVIDRIQEFKKKSVALYKKHRIPRQSQLQGENTITTYLWLKYPDKYYIYKINMLCALAVKIDCSRSFREGVDTNRLNDKDRLKDFYNLYDEICFYIDKDKNFIDIVNEQLEQFKGTCYQDPKHKTLTSDFAFYIKQKEDDDNSYDGYWWLVAKPNRWNLSELKKGGIQEYYSRTEKGRSQIYRNFVAVKTGDKVIGYEASPSKKIVATCEIAEEHKDNIIKIKKLDDVTRDISYTRLKSIPELQNMEFFRNPNGSLFKLSETEYNCITDLINGTYQDKKQRLNSKKYTEEDFLKEVFMSKDQYKKLLKILEQKKNIILKGVPGVGKTFAAKRLAYSIMKEKDDSRIKFIQFHQNYSYEEFMKGYKPSGDGFTLENGVFYDFCKAADKDKSRPYFFIIDEINRGNISKIFGELLMLIESEYREEKITLPYKNGDFYEEFSIPKNLYIIGMMNTADRSIAMLDYALRRRFCHFELNPAFDTLEFKNWLRSNNSNTKKATKLITKIKKLNREITKNLGKGFCIGHSYFCKKNLTEEDLEIIVEHEIIPALEQYWFDEPYKVILWTKILRGEKDLSEVDKDNIEDTIKKEMEEEEKKEIEKEKNEDSNAEGTAAE